MRRKTKKILAENNRLELQLSKGNQKLMTDIVVYLRGSKCGVAEQEMVRRDIIQMIADAERRGETADSVIGPDPKEFCESIIAELPRQSAAILLLSSIRDILPGAAVLMLIWLVTGAVEALLTDGEWTSVPLTLGQLISGTGILLTACGIVYWICRYSFSVENSRLIWFLLFLVLCVLLSLSFFLKQPSVRIPFWMAACGIAAVCLVYRLMDARLD